MEQTKKANSDILKKFNLQELEINPCFASFINWFGNVSEENILTSEEILKSNEMKKGNKFINDADTVNIEIQKKIGKSIYDDDMIEDLEEECDELMESLEAYEDILSKARASESILDSELNRSNSECESLEIKIKQLYENSKEDAKALESLCTKNIENRQSLLYSFSGQNSDPLRWCRIDLDNYCVNCEDVALSLKLRFEQKLKMTSFVDLDNQNLRRLYELEGLKENYYKKILAEFDTECDLKKVNIMMETLSKPFEPMCYTTMIERTRQISTLNEDMQETIESLEASIYEKIKYLAYQEAKFCELESNREKLKTAEKRLNILKAARKPIADILLVADILWLSLNMERQEMKNILDKISMTRYEEDNKQCARNMQILTKVSANSTDDDDVTINFSNKVSDIIRGGLKPSLMNSSNSVVECTESTIDRDMKLQQTISDSYQMKIVDLINNFDSVSQEMNKIIGDGPLNIPNIRNLSIVADTEFFQRKYELMFESSRTMRHNFMEKYHQPSISDELWKRRQFLWILFLTDEKQFLEVLESTINESKKTGISSSKMSTFAGLRRQK